MLKIFFDIVIGNDDILVNDENIFVFNILDVCDDIYYIWECIGRNWKCWKFIKFLNVLILL